MTAVHLPYSKILSNYMPAEAAELAAQWIIDYNFNLKITRARQTKLGDYMAPLKPGDRHQITINHNLNPYAFLITFVHEVAHLTTYVKYGNKVKAHGAEWKAEFRGLMLPYFQLAIFPDDVGKALIRYLGNPAATSCNDLNLQRVLKKYDSEIHQETGLHLEQLANNARFLYKERIFIKGPKIRKRFRCIEVKTKHIYLFSPVTSVKLID